MRSWVRVVKRRINTSPSLVAKTLGHPAGSAIGIPSSCSNGRAREQEDGDRAPDYNAESLGDGPKEQRPL